MKIEKFTEIIDIVKIKASESEMECIYNGTDVHIKKELDKYGANGYELVDSRHTAASSSEYYEYILKKSIKTIDDERMC